MGKVSQDQPKSFSGAARPKPSSSSPPYAPGSGEAPVVPLKVAEAYSPRRRDRGEMPLALGELVYCFETLANKGWLFGFTCDDKLEVKSQGRVPAAFLVPAGEDLEVALETAA